MRKILEYTEKDLEPTNSFNLHDFLQPDIWSDYKIDSGIRERLLDIANQYINSIRGSFKVYDIILIGSLASYNWSKYSDFDLHVVIEYKDINEDIELVEEYLDIHKKLWNKKYDIYILGFPVEIFTENKGRDTGHINGIFSIFKNKWLKKSSKKEIDIDINLIETKAKSIMTSVDELEKSTQEQAVETDRTLDDLNKVWDKVKRGRSEGLASPQGEFAIGNLVFKYLRRNEYISKMIEIRKNLIEQKYSI